jgi:hypothetical protein
MPDAEESRHPRGRTVAPSALQADLRAGPVWPAKVPDVTFSHRRNEEYPLDERKSSPPWDFPGVPPPGGNSPALGIPVTAMAAIPGLRPMGEWLSSLRRKGRRHRGGFPMEDRHASLNRAGAW